MKFFISLGLAALIGVGIRYLMVTLISPSALALIIVNGLGCLGAGFIFLDHTEISKILSIGLFGALTTYSAYNTQLFSWLQEGRWLEVLGYTVLMNLLCLGCFMLGHTFRLYLN